MIFLARHAIAHRRGWLWLVALATVGLGSGLLRLQLRTDGDVLRPVGDSFVESTRSDGLLFHDPRQVLLLVSARQGGPSVVSPRGFRFLAALQRDLRQLDPVRATGILSAPALPRPVRGGGGFSLGTFFDDIPDQADQFARLVAELRAQRVTTGLLLSRDGRYAAYYVPLVESGRVANLIDQLEQWLHTRLDTDFYVRIGGPEMAEASLGRTVLRDLTVMVPVMLVMIITMLFVVLGNVGGVIITMAEALVVLIWTFGAMGWAGVPVTLVTTILPVVLMALSITDEIHLLERVQDKATVAPDGRLADWVETALVEVGKPIIATSVTTALGLLSFVSASIVPLRQFGVFAAFGILVAMALSFTWIPALIVALPQRWFVPRVSRSRQRSLPLLGRWVTRRPFVALVWGLLIVATALPGLLRLRVQDAWVDNFASDAQLVTTERDYNDAFWGSYRFDIVVEGPHEFFYTPTGTDLTERLRRLVAEAPYVGGVLTHLAMLEGVAGALDQHGALSNLSPLMLADIAIVAEMSENRLRLQQLLTTGGEATRVRVFVPDADYGRAREIEAYLDNHLPALAEQYGVAYHYSGDLPTALATVDAIVGNQLRSVGWALLTVVLVLFVLFAPGKQALVCMTPVVAAVVVVFGGMG
ncbi:MAG: RND family transporter, partial [Candidatus Binatia bacterium]